MKNAITTTQPIELTEELETRRRLNKVYDSFLKDLSNGGLSIESPSDLEALALLFLEVTEERKKAEKQEKILKEELKRHFPEGTQALPCGSCLLIRDSRTRSGFNKESFIRDFGTEAYGKYETQTTYEIFSVKRIG